MGNCGREASFDQRPEMRRRREEGGGRGEQQAIQKSEAVKQACRMGDPGTTESLGPQWDPSRTKR